MLKAYRIKKTQYLDAFSKQIGVPAHTILSLNAWLDDPYILTQGDLVYLPSAAFGQDEEEDDMTLEEEAAPDEEETSDEEEETAPEEEETASEEESEPEEIPAPDEEEETEEEEEAVEPPEEPEEEEPEDAEESGWFSSAALDVIGVMKKTGVIPSGINSLSDVEKLAVAKAIPAAAALIHPKISPKPMPGGVKLPASKTGAKLPGKAAQAARVPASGAATGVPVGIAAAVAAWFLFKK